MDKLEREVREAAREYHDASEALRRLGLLNTRSDPDEARAQTEAYEMAKARQARAWHRLNDAKSAYARG